MRIGGTLALVVLMAPLVACGPSAEKEVIPAAPVEVAPAPAPAVPAAPASPLATYSQNLDKPVTAAGDPVIFNYFCNALAKAPCDADIIKRLTSEGFADSKSALELGMAATAAKLRSEGKTLDKSTDDEFVKAAYLMVLGREADEVGLTSNVGLLTDTKDRVKCLRGLMESPEFQQRPY